MSRDGYRGPRLPSALLNQVQADSDARGKRNFASRKDRRKTERQEKKSQRSQGGEARNGRRRPDVRGKHGEQNDRQYEQEKYNDKPTAAAKNRPIAAAQVARPLKSALKKATTPAPVGLVEVSDNESDEEEEPSAPTVSRGVKRKLEDDDAEIAALEKKLGIRGKKSKAPETDGLDWLIDGSEGESDVEFQRASNSRRPEDVKWLQDKRLKANKKVARGAVAEVVDDADGTDTSGSNPDDEYESDEDIEQVEVEEDEGDEHDFEGFESESSEDGEPTAKQPRENPYVAPVSNSTTKYIPPSMRKPATSEEESLRQLRRQLQGLLNRLSEANMLSILKSVEDLYSNNPRQHVTSTVVDLLVGLIADSAVLNDTFLILHTGFATALYKSIGTDFGAHLLEKVVESFHHHRETEASGKQPLNLLAFLSNLYTFQLVGSSLIFDYIRILLEEMSEDNTELLLRLIRTSGQQLRQDDPSSLKDIVLLLQRSVAATGEETLSVRTKFMIETINDLKNNRMKSGAATSAMVAEHATRMKKTLASLTNSRSIKASEPLRISLSDIRDSDKKGKWWLVGASYLDPNKHQHSNTPSTSTRDIEDAGYESETPDSVNLNRLARAQGMNTEIRRAIFTTILSSSDYKEAHLRLLKLHLKPKQQLEIPRVLIHCVGIEKVYNPFYSLVARQFCQEHKLRKALQFALWDAFQEMDGDDGLGGEEEGGMVMWKVLNLAKFYAFLVVNRALDVRVLKKLNLASPSTQQSMFVEMFLTTILVLAQKTRSDGLSQDAIVKEIFARAAGVEGLAQGLVDFIEEVVSKADLARGKTEQKAVIQGCEVAVEALRHAAAKATLVEDSEDEEDDE